MTEHIYKPLPSGLVISKSSIHGLGLFTEKDFPMSTFFGISHIHSTFVPGDMVNVTFSFLENNVKDFYEGNHLPLTQAQGEEFYIKKDTIFPNGLIRTPLGGFINHSADGNVNLVYMNSGMWGLIANRDIKAGEEITTDYQYTPCGVIRQ
jgi:hypothetical protein